MMVRQVYNNNFCPLPTRCPQTSVAPWELKTVKTESYNSRSTCWLEVLQGEGEVLLVVQDSWSYTRGRVHHVARSCPPRLRTRAKNLYPRGVTSACPRCSPHWIPCSDQPCVGPHHYRPSELHLHHVQVLPHQAEIIRLPRFSVLACECACCMLSGL